MVNKDGMKVLLWYYGKERGFQEGGRVRIKKRQWRVGRMSIGFIYEL